MFATDRVSLDEQSLKNRGLDVDSGEYLRVTIRDTGIGMDAATRKRVFEPFFTRKGRGKGTGMGMASVYGTVKSHHGAIEVESEPGSGTTMTVYFPLVLGEGEKSQATVLEKRRTGGRVLIVDDEKEVAASMSVMLRAKGYETTSCASGREALEVFERSWQQTDVVLLDMIMPEMGGVEVFHALKAIDPDVKVVFISGYSLTREAKRIGKEGAAGYLAKPVMAEDLLKTIDDVIRLNRRETG